MTSPENTPNLDDVIDPTENAPRDRQEPAKEPHLADEVLEHRTEPARPAVGSDDAAPGGADEHDATS